MNRLSSDTDRLDLSSKYRIAFLTMVARFCCAAVRGGRPPPGAAAAAAAPGFPPPAAPAAAAPPAGGGLSGSSAIACSSLRTKEKKNRFCISIQRICSATDQCMLSCIAFRYIGDTGESFLLPGALEYILCIKITCC